MLTRRERLAALACVLLLLAALCVGCAPRVIPNDDVEQRRETCLRNGGDFRKGFNDDGSVNWTRCDSVESHQ
mgnify:CR=1 FL=1